MRGAPVTIVDSLLDRLVVPGNSRIGYQLRRRGRRWPDDPPPGALDGADALVTGAGSGFGTATAAGPARLGARVHLLGRPRPPGTRPRREIGRRAPGRVIFVSSSGMYGQRLHSEDPQYLTGSYRGLTAYAGTKRMQVVLAEEWASRPADEGVVVHAVHPGWAETPGLARWLPRFRAITRPVPRTAEEGADTTVWVAAAPEPCAAAGCSGTTARRGRRTCCRTPRRQPAGGTGCGASASG